MAKLDIQSSRTRAIWRSCLSSSLRTTLACAIVACTKYYGPATLSRQLAFPALSYVTTILICADATFGEALHGTVCALYGSLQGVVPAVVVLWAVGPARFTITISTVAIALSAFLVALAESTHVIAKRVALLQIVVVYVTTFMHGTGTDPVMHPLRVGVSSGVGAIAAVVAVLLPFPHLGYLEVRKTRKLFIKFSVEKLKLFVNAFCAENNASSAASISQAKSSSKACNRLLQIVKIKQTSLKWESLGFGRESSSALAADRLQALATPMNGMEMALSSCPSFPLKIVDSELKNHLRDFMNYISLRLMQLKYAYHKDSSTVHESKNGDAPDKSVQSSFRVPFPSQNDLPSFFFLFCMKLLHDECTSSPSYQVTIPGKKTISMIPSKEPVVDSIKEESSIMRRILTNALKSCSRRRFLIAFRCSLTLGHSVLFGMLFSRENGYWGGLVIASSMTPFREATYRAANTRAQGTVLGSIYGLLGCYISQRLMEVRFIVLLPWLIFSSFLTRSRMYGPAGGISAAVAAILIMGRKDYGSVTEFVIIRITETFISLTCSICVELLLQPTRASTLARFQLSESFNTLHSCVESLHDISKLKRDLSKLKGHVNELIKFIDEAIMEPNFWFLPFAGPAYSNLSGSLSKMMELLLFGSHALEFLYHESQKSSLSWMEIHGTIEGDLDLFRRSLCPSIKSLEDITKMKSLEKLETDFQRKKGSNDLESGKTPKAVEYRNLCADEEEAEKMIAAFLQHTEEILNHVADGDEEVMTRMVLWLSALGYCMGELMKEGRQLEKGLKELVQCENPASHVNLHEISCKIRDLST